MIIRNLLSGWGWRRSVLILSLFLVATGVYAGQYTYEPLVGLPQLSGQGKTLSDYFNQIYIATIAIGAILAFIKISIAGVKWSMSDIVTDKSDAKKDIQGALLGLAILLIPFIVLNTIYSGLTKLNVLDKASSVSITPAVNTTQIPTQNTTNQTQQQPPLPKVGYTMINCNFTPIKTGTDMNGAPIYGSYDGTDCKQQCASLYGTIAKETQYNLWCEYLQAQTCNPLNGDVCNGQTPGGA